MEPGDLTTHGWLVVDCRGNESHHKDYGWAMQYAQKNHGTVHALITLDDHLETIEAMFEPAENQVGKI